MNREFQKQLDTILKGGPSKLAKPTLLGTSAPGLGSSSYSASSFGSSGTVLDSLKETSMFQKVFYIVMAIFVILLLLIAIHFLIHPILPEWIVNNVPLPGMSDEKVYWNKGGILEDIANDKTPIMQIYKNLTVMLDVQVDNPTARIGQSRVILTRGSLENPNDTTSQNDYQKSGLEIRRIIPNFNFVYFFDPNSTDLYIYVSTRNDSGTTSQELVKIPNFPIQRSVRLTMVILNRTVEVYINGELFKIHTLTAPVMDTKGDIHPPLRTVMDNDATSSLFGRVKNLRLWARPLLAKDIRTYGAGESFPGVQINDTCVS